MLGALVVTTLNIRLKGGADGRRVGIDPGLREGAALVRLYGVDAAEVALCEKRARSVWTAVQHEAAAIRGKLGLLLDELRLVHAEERGDSGDLRFADANDSVLSAAACPASSAYEAHARLHFSTSHEPPSRTGRR